MTDIISKHLPEGTMLLIMRDATDDGSYITWSMEWIMRCATDEHMVQASLYALEQAEKSLHELVEQNRPGSPQVN